MDSLTPEQRHKCMSHIRSKDTSVEVMLRKALWHAGIRYRKNYDKLPGKPDIAITKYKIVVFCDGELWHGKDWNTRKETIKTNRDYWIQKIERNIKRDSENEKKLEKLGWIVIRFWGKEIKKNIEFCISEIKETIYEVKTGCYNLQYYPVENIEETSDLLAAEIEPEYNTNLIV
jgi:DNA mismatch endonuclease (patch repair protein)